MPPGPPPLPFGAPYALLVDPAVPGPALDGKTLTLVTRHGGGCGEHTWSVDRQEGAGLRLALKHDGGGDLCRALLRADVRVDLEPWWTEICAGTPITLVVNAATDRDERPVEITVPVDGAACP